MQRRSAHIDQRADARHGVDHKWQIDLDQRAKETARLQMDEAADLRVVGLGADATDGDRRRFDHGDSRSGRE
ncbi:hypothetical protein D9M72_456800 [compost metagenome]